MLPKSCPRKLFHLQQPKSSPLNPLIKEQFLADGDGLDLRVRPKGSKVWIFKCYHPITRNRTNMSFGSYPEISLAKARQLRLDSRELLASGISPKQHRDTENIAKKNAS